MTTIAIEPKPRREYSDDEKREAVVLMFTLGTQSAVSAALDIPQRTISDWMKTDWWGVYHAEMVKACKDEQGAGYRHIVAKAQKELIDRLEHGDLRRDRAGKLKRTPITAKDLMVITAIATDKDRILRGEPTSISAKATDLGAAARDFERIATGGGEASGPKAPISASEPHKPAPAKRH